MNLRQVRTTLAGALTAAGVKGVYQDPPGQVSPPCVIVAPDDPYLEPRTIGAADGSSSVRVRLRLLACVAHRDSPGALDKLEQLIVAVWTGLPSGTEVGDASAPSLEQVGPAELLTSSIPIQLTVTT